MNNLFPPDDLPVVDGHLDLAENVTIFGRDLTLPAAEIRRREKLTSRQAAVSLPELQRGGVAVVIATVTAGFKPQEVSASFVPPSAFYSTPEQAQAQALSQIALYERWDSQGLVRLIKSAADLQHHLELWRQDRTPGLVMLMEGADPIREPDELHFWWQRGLRLVGLTFGDTRYGCGTRGGSLNFKQGGLSPDGRRLLENMAEAGMIWDISHLAEQGIWQGLEQAGLAVCASHANARALTPTDRHLSDAVIAAVAGRGGVIGLVLYNSFLERAWKQDPSIPVSLAVHLRRQAEYMAGIAGWQCVGLGSDLDGGFGLEESPQEIDSVADLRLAGQAVPPEARRLVLGEAWLNFLRRALPQRVEG